ncbi:hypothetical protein H6B07_20145, partial [Mediterraneibacter glycyrrhizinilyticus]|nr:hypothetical protein [Mediterraneibacter glycyrrhizinilyticus]
SSSLDVDAIQDLHDLLLLLKAQGKTILISEHRLYFLKDIIDQGLVLLIFIYGIASGKPKYSVITALVYGVLIGIAVLSNLYLTG